MSRTSFFLSGWRRIAAAGALALAATLSLQSIAAAQHVVAFVNGDPITAFDLEQRTKLNSLGGKAPPARQAVLDELVNEKIKIHLLKRYTMEVTDKEVEDSYASMAKRMKADLVWGAIVRGKFQSSLQINEKELRTALETRKKDDKAAVAYEYSLRPVLFIVPRGSAENAIETRRKEAEALRNRFQS